MSGKSKIYLSLIILLSSCGADKGQFRMKGEFKGFNQGEFYVYSADDGYRQLDTIRVSGGTFSYETAVDSIATFVLVFPNYSEIPVFGASGATASVEGDASHLKEIKVTGTDENELMTGFRLKTSNMTPPEVINEAASFILAHPVAPSSRYLLNKHFIQTPTPDYKRAADLVSAMLTANPSQERLVSLKKYLEGMKGLRDKASLPKFACSDIKGKPISNADLYAKVNVITTWASWNYESTNIQRQLKAMEKEYGSNRLKIMSICLDASDKECRKQMDRDSITWSNVCDGRMWETPALVKLGLTKVPDNIVSDSKGHIIAHSLPLKELKEKIDSIIK